MSKGGFHFAALMNLVLACAITPQYGHAEDRYVDAVEALRQLGATIATNPDGTVRVVVLDGPQFLDGSLGLVKDLVDLNTLCLRRVKITDAGLHSLANLRHLKYLFVAHSDITDTAVPVIAAMKSLTRVELYGTQLTAQGIERLGTLRPDIRIGKGGLLGIGLGADREVRAVLGPAKKAGLQVGDVVTHCQGKPIDDLNSVAKIVGEATPGGNVSLRITRAGKDLTLRVVVGDVIAPLIGEQDESPQQNDRGAKHR